MLKKRNWQAAADEFRMVIKIDPRRAQAHDGLGLALARQGKPQEALAEYRRSLEIDPYYLGDILRQRGDLEGAVRAFEKALRLRPDLQEGYYSLGSTLKQLAATRRASQEFPPRETLGSAEELYKQGLAALGTALSPNSCNRIIFVRCQAVPRSKTSVEGCDIPSA
ncbi:MAG: tetratricopeptide repeat protein [Terriglobia bacterium]